MFIILTLVKALAGPGDLRTAPDWNQAALDVSAWQGQEVVLGFQVVRCTDQPFSVTLDRVSLGSAGPE